MSIEGEKGQSRGQDAKFSWSPESLPFIATIADNYTHIGVGIMAVPPTNNRNSTSNSSSSSSSSSTSNESSWRAGRAASHADDDPDDDLLSEGMIARKAAHILGQIAGSRRTESDKRPFFLAVGFRRWVGLVVEGEERDGIDGVGVASGTD